AAADAPVALPSEWSSTPAPAGADVGGAPKWSVTPAPPRNEPASVAAPASQDPWDALGPAAPAAEVELPDEWGGQIEIEPASAQSPAVLSERALSGSASEDVWGALAPEPRAPELAPALSQPAPQPSAPISTP